MRKYTIMHKLTDQSLLAEVAKTAADAETAESAMNRISDQETLINLAKSTPHLNVCLGVIRKVGDTAFLKDMSKASNPAISTAASEKLRTITAQSVPDISGPFSAGRFLSFLLSLGVLFSGIAAENGVTILLGIVWLIIDIIAVFVRK